jgi:hypothetical protein
MQVATVSTRAASLRSSIDGYTVEDTKLLVRKQPPQPSPGKIFIGYTPTANALPAYDCILHMLADGWKLLGPPQREEHEVGECPEQWEWWLERESPP